MSRTTAAGAPAYESHPVRDGVLTVVTAVVGLVAAAASFVGVGLLTGW